MLLLPDPDKWTQTPRIISASGDEVIAASGSALESTWQLPATARGDFHYVAPDTCTDVILGINPDGHLQALVAMPSSSFAVVPRTPGWGYVGARVRPGFGSVLFGSNERLPPDLALRRVQNLDDARRRLFDRLSEITSTRRDAAPPWIAEITRHAARFDMHGGQVAAIARHVGVRPRTFHRGVLAWTGMTPKDFLRVERARAAARLLAHRQPAIDTAFALGFADQAHMIRELRALFGFSGREIQSLDPVADFFKMFRSSTPMIGA